MVQCVRHFVQLTSMGSQRPFDSHSSLLFRIIFHIQTPRPTAITSIMIPPNQGLCILSLLSYLETFPMFTSALDRIISSHSYASAKSYRQPNTPFPPPRLVRSTLSPFFSSPLQLENLRTSLMLSQHRSCRTDDDLLSRSRIYV
jgi:hypothetical protein